MRCCVSCLIAYQVKRRAAQSGSLTYTQLSFVRYRNRLRAKGNLYAVVVLTADYFLNAISPVAGSMASTMASESKR